MGVAVKYLMVIVAVLLTIWGPTKVVAAGCQGGSNMAVCADRYVCTLASSSVFKYYKRASQEAANRGLSCLQVLRSAPPLRSTPTVRRSFLHNSFRVLSVEERKDIQSALLSLEMYSSTIDGLYGKGTAAALNAYNKEYLGNSDLTKKANVEALFADILKPLPSDDTQVVAAQLEPESATTEPNVEPAVAPVAEAEEAPITLADMQEAYDRKDYFKARETAEALAIEGEAEAQFLLGKMYADGLGTLQLSKNAHMWFNIASLNGSVEAIEGRNAVAATMSQDAVNEAQDMAVKCIQSNYADCGLLVKQNTAVTAAPDSSRSIVNGNVLISNFKDQSSLRRKQLQYALKKLGLYSSTVDGLWGNNTSKAFTNYIKVNEIVAQEAEEVFTSILSKVDVPNSFASTRAVSKPKVASKPSKPTFRVPSGWRLVTNNPQHSFEQSNAICKPMSENAGSSVKQFKMDSNSFNCFGNSYSVNCSESSGGFAEGFAESFVTGMNRKKARKRAYASCMAQYGWVER